MEIDSFNKRVVNENFNRVICQEIAKHIDPDFPGKTLVFCVIDSHADRVVDELKRAFDDRYGSVPDDAIRKITGKADKPLQLIRKVLRQETRRQQRWSRAGRTGRDRGDDPGASD